MRRPLRPLLLLLGLLPLAACGGGDDRSILRLEPERLVRTVTAEGNLAAVVATPVSVPTEVEDQLQVVWIADDGSLVKAGEVVARLDASALQRSRTEAEIGRRSAEAKLARMAAEQQSLARGLDRDAELAAKEHAFATGFRRTDTEIWSRRQIAESGIDAGLAEAKKEHAETVRTARGRLGEADRGLLELERRKSEIEIDRLTRTLGAVEIRAPHDGLFLAFRSPGGWQAKAGTSVWGGQLLGEIPDPAKMKATVFVLEADAGGLAVGQPATVVLEARPGRPVTGRVEQVAALAKPRLRGSPVQFFEASIALADAGGLLRPGARVRATITLEDRADALVVPRSAVAESEGRSVVYRVADDGRAEPVTVVLGPGSPGRAVVEKGLVAGDRILRVAPAGTAGDTAATAGAAPAPTPTGGGR